MSDEEKKPLVEKEGAPADEPSATCMSKWAGPAAIGFYIFIAVLKTMLTYVLFHSGSSYPVGFSAVSAVATCLCVVPVFVVNSSTWAVPSLKILPGFLLVCTLVALDLALANIAISMLAIAIQQCVIATNPAFTVTIESIVRSKLYHPAIYVTVAILCVGPILAQVGADASDASLAGIGIQILGVLCSACKYVFAHSVMHACKKELGTFSFLFWIDTLILIILVPWSLFNGELVALLKAPANALDWVNLILTAVLGGVRFFSQLLVLRVSTATTLSCANIAFQAINIYLSIVLFGKPQLSGWLVAGSLVTLGSAGTYTYFKLSKILEKDQKCVQIHEDFKACCSCGKAAEKDSV